MYHVEAMRNQEAEVRNEIYAEKYIYIKLTLNSVMKVFPEARRQVCTELDIQFDCFFPLY